MIVYAQPSQRATWPPSAAVRQRSIALITFIWSRLTWPALALRHAAPWSRKISATSSNGRDMAAGGYAGSGSLRVWAKLARIHVLDHALAQRADSFDTHGNSRLG